MTMKAGSTPPIQWSASDALRKQNRFHVGDPTQNLREARERRLLVVDDGDVHLPLPAQRRTTEKTRVARKAPSK